MEPDFGDILRTFALETEENLRALDEGFVVLEQNPDDAETLATIFRMAHTLKGNAASLGFSALTEFAHGFEEILELLRRREIAAHPALITLLLESVDALRKLVAAAMAGEVEMPPSHRNLLERIVVAAESGRAAQASTRSADAPAGGDRATRGADAPASVAYEVHESLAPPRPLVASRPTLRVDVGRLDRMLDLAGEIAIERARMRGLIATLGPSGAWLAERHAESDGLYGQVQELVMDLRMVRIGPLFRQQTRTVRDVAAGVGKQARLVLEGEDEEMDTAIVEHLKDPLTHMIRNALDHGIETPDVRHRKGKDLCGTVTLRARHEAGVIVVEIADDGAGLPREAIAARARELGIPEPEALPEGELFALIFAPGFSTADAITDLSGRGVGLDVVMKSVKALRGTIAIESHPGKGTTFTMRLPLTVAIIDGFAVSAGKETYIVPLESVRACLELPPGAGDGPRRVLEVEGAAVPFFRLREVFALPRLLAHDSGRVVTPRESLVLLRNNHSSVGVAVDELLGVTQVVIKSPGKLLEGRPGVAGSTILGSGEVAFILDVPGLLRMAAPPPATWAGGQLRGEP